MLTPKKLGKDFQLELSQHYRWLMNGGILLILASIFLLLNISEYRHDFLIGGAILFISLLILIHSFKFWYRKNIGLFLHLCTAILYAIIGSAVIFHYQVHIFNLLILLLISYLLSGLFRIKLALFEGLNYLGWSSTFICGIVDIILFSILLLLKDSILPTVLVGYTISIDAFFTGIAIFLLGYKYRKNFLIKKEKHR